MFMSKFLKADLHMHTTNSDGTSTFNEIKEMITSTGANKVVSITDHHYMTINKAFEEDAILWIPGIEISADANGQSVHITWYGLEPQFSPKLKNILQTIIDGYMDRANRVRERWISLWYSVPELNEFRDSSLPPPIYKTDLACQLGKIAWLTDTKEIRLRAKENGNLLFSEEESFMPDISELIPAMHESGLIACRAHPWKSLFRNPEEMEKSMKTLDIITDAGIDGIEPFAHKHTEEQTNFFINEAKKRKLLISWWSDYHWDKGHSISYPISSEYVQLFLDKIGYLQ